MSTLLQNDEAYRVKYLYMDDFREGIFSDKVRNSQGLEISYFEILLLLMKIENSLPLVSVVSYVLKYLLVGFY